MDALLRLQRCDVVTRCASSACLFVYMIFRFIVSVIQIRSLSPFVPILSPFCPNFVPGVLNFLFLVSFLLAGSFA